MKKSPTILPAKTIDEYLAMVPEEVLILLENLREIIKKIVPNAEEVISYQIPTFKYFGALVGFAAFKNHCSFYVMSPPLIVSLKEELKAYTYSGATIHFSVDKPLPVELVEKLVRARIKENEEKMKNKKPKQK